MKEEVLYLGDFNLSSGEVVGDTKAFYSLYGEAAEDGSNVVWVIHALTANSRVDQWWSGIVGEAAWIDTTEYAVICVNNLGSCYGSTGPSHCREEQKYVAFPEFTIGDMAHFLDEVRLNLGWSRIHTVIGGSMGGQIALEWLVARPEVFNSAVLLATNASHSSWGRACNESQRMAIESDPDFTSGEASNGLKAARAMAMLSYRNYNTYKRLQDDPDGERPLTYQRYQGAKLANRFNAWSYYRLSQAMDSHDLGKSVHLQTEQALERIRIPVLIIGIKGDLLFPVEEQRYLYEHIPASHMHLIDSIYGHDGFLTETESIGPLLGKFLQSNSTRRLKEYSEL